MHIIFKLRIGFMIVKRETWLNNTQRYRAHIYIYTYMYVSTYIDIYIYGLGFRVYGDLVSRLMMGMGLVVI